jgi:hypothetical protein
MKSATARLEISSPTSVAIAGPRVSSVESLDLLSKEDNRTGWGTLKASAKALRTVNPIRAIMEPIGKTIQSGEARGDGKDLITLAVRFSCSLIGRSIALNASLFASIPRMHSQCSLLNYFHIHTFLLYCSWGIQPQPGTSLPVPRQSKPSWMPCKDRATRLAMSTPAERWRLVQQWPPFIRRLCLLVATSK